MKEIINKIQGGELVHLEEYVQYIPNLTTEDIETIFNDVETEGTVKLGIENGYFGVTTMFNLPDGREENLRVISNNYELFGYKYGKEEMQRYKPYVKVYNEVRKNLRKNKESRR